MIWSVLSGSCRGIPPVASNSFAKRYFVPRSSVAWCARGSIDATRRPRCSSAPVAAVLRQIFSSGSPFQSAFESGGRSYGGGGAGAGPPDPAGGGGLRGGRGGGRRGRCRPPPRPEENTGLVDAPFFGGEGGG